MCSGGPKNSERAKKLHRGNFTDAQRVRRLALSAQRHQDEKNGASFYLEAK